MFEMGKKGTDKGRDDMARDNDPKPSAQPTTTKPVPGPAPTPARTTTTGHTAVIGPSINIEGTLRGEEDLVIEGNVTGTIELKKHQVTIGEHGTVDADVFAHTVCVDGTLNGSVSATDHIAVRRSAHVQGHVASPRVAIEEGAWFKGSIDMDADAVKTAAGGSPNNPNNIKRS